MTSTSAEGSRLRHGQRQRPGADGEDGVGEREVAGNGELSTQLYRPSRHVESGMVQVGRLHGSARRVQDG